MVAVTFADLKDQQASSPVRRERHEEEDALRMVGLSPVGDLIIFSMGSLGSEHPSVLG